MKKIYLFSTLVAGLLMFNSCDNEPDFPGLDKESQITNVAKYVTEYTGVVFAENNPARNTLPAWLDTKYKTADKGSTAMVDYKYTLTTPEYITALGATVPYTLGAEDYREAWGEESTLNYFSPSKPARSFLPAILGKAIAEPEEGDIIAATYNEAEEDGSAPVFKEDFESGTLDNWESLNFAGSNTWRTSVFDNNTYAQQSAYRDADGYLNSYLISKKPISITSGLVLSFDALLCNFRDEGGRVNILISTDLKGFTQNDVTGAAWDDITGNFTFAESPNNSGDMIPVANYSLDAYSGREIYIAFQYEGNSNTNATTTVRIDNITIQPADQTPVDYKARTALYKYESDAWKLYEDAYILQPEDYTAMGVNDFTPTAAQAYIPGFLAYKYPLVASGTIKAVVFKTPNDTFMAAEYQKTVTHWESTAGTTSLTDEYEYDGANWKYVRTIPKAALNITFDDREINDKDKTMIEGWLNVTTIGTDYWRDRKYSGNNYIEATAYGGTSENKVELWFITPALEIKNNYILTFDMVSGHWTHEALEVYISSAFSGEAEDVPVVYTEDNNEDALAGSGKEVAGWKNLTGSFDFPVKTGGYSPFTNVGKANLDDYAGQTVHIAFRYWGNKTGLTSTVQLDNIYVGE